MYLVWIKEVGFKSFILPHFYSQITVTVTECLICVRHRSHSFTWSFLFSSMPTGHCYHHSDFTDEDREFKWPIYHHMDSQWLIWTLWGLLFPLNPRALNLCSALITPVQVLWSPRRGDSPYSHGQRSSKVNLSWSEKWLRSDVRKVINLEK